MYKQISEYPNYSVTKGGVIFNNTTRKILKQHKKNSGYWQVCLFDDFHKRHYVSVHRVVAAAYCDNPENKAEVNHIDGNKDNNHASNLEWVTRNENLKHAFAKGIKANDTSAKGVVGTKITTGEKVIFESIYAAAKKLRISQGNICMCCRGQRPYAGGYVWAYIDRFGDQKKLIQEGE